MKANRKGGRIECDTLSEKERESKQAVASESAQSQRELQFQLEDTTPATYGASRLISSFFMHTQPVKVLAS
jgi:hypothetical protein